MLTLVQGLRLLYEFCVLVCCLAVLLEQMLVVLLAYLDLSLLLLQLLGSVFFLLVEGVFVLVVVLDHEQVRLLQP